MEDVGRMVVTRLVTGARADKGWREASGARVSLEAAEQTRTNIIQNYPARRSRLTYFISGKGFCRGQGVEMISLSLSHSLSFSFACTAVRNLVIVERATSASRESFGSRVNSVGVEKRWPV